MPENRASLKEVAATVKRNPALLIALIVVAIVVAYILYKRNQSATSTAAPASTDPNAYLIYNAVETPNVTVNNTTPTDHPAPVPGPIPTPSGAPIPTSVPTSSNPLIPYGKYPSGNPYSTAADLKAHPTITWNGVTYLKVPGKGNRLWGKPIKGGPQVLLYGDRNAYK